MFLPTDQTQSLLSELPLCTQPLLWDASRKCNILSHEKIGETENNGVQGVRSAMPELQLYVICTVFLFLSKESQLSLKLSYSSKIRTTSKEMKITFKLTEKMGFIFFQGNWCWTCKSCTNCLILVNTN